MMAYNDSDPAEEVLRGWELEDARAAGDLFSCVDAINQGGMQWWHALAWRKYRC